MKGIPLEQSLCQTNGACQFRLLQRLWPLTSLLMGKKPDSLTVHEGARRTAEKGEDRLSA